jgi:hypothetical protein
MFETGEKVVCVNDDFPPLVRRIYQRLPTKDEIYTVRECSLGRLKSGGPDSGISYRVLLVELVNGPDPYMNPDHAEELGFRSDRFAPLIDVEDESERQFAESDSKAF